MVSTSLSWSVLGNCTLPHIFSEGNSVSSNLIELIRNMCQAGIYILSLSQELIWVYKFVFLAEVYKWIHRWFVSVYCFFIIIIYFYITIFFLLSALGFGRLLWNIPTNSSFEPLVNVLPHTIEKNLQSNSTNMTVGGSLKMSLYSEQYKQEQHNLKGRLLLKKLYMQVTATIFKGYSFITLKWDIFCVFSCMYIFLMMEIF